MLFLVSRGILCLAVLITIISLIWNQPYLGTLDILLMSALTGAAAVSAREIGINPSRQSVAFGTAVSALGLGIVGLLALELILGTGNIADIAMHFVFAGAFAVVLYKNLSLGKKNR